MKKILVVIAVAAATLSVSAVASGENYAGVGVGVSHGLQQQDAGAGKVFLGAQFSQALAGEVSIVDLGQLGSTTVRAVTLDTVLRSPAMSGTRGTFLLGRVGVTSWLAETDSSSRVVACHHAPPPPPAPSPCAPTSETIPSVARRGTDFDLGVGVEHRITSDWRVRLEGTRYYGIDIVLGTLSLIGEF